jgi:hypothetical protein
MNFGAACGVADMVNSFVTWNVRVATSLGANEHKFRSNTVPIEAKVSIDRVADHACSASGVKFLTVEHHLRHIEVIGPSFPLMQRPRIRIQSCAPRTSFRRAKIKNPKAKLTSVSRPAAL